MSNVEKYELNGTEYRFIVMPPTSALPLMAKIGNIIGGGAGNLDISAFADIGNKEGMSSSTINAIMSILKDLKESDLMFIINASQPFIKIIENGKPIKVNIDQHFVGKILDLLKVIAAFLKYTFNDFFSVLL